MTEAEQWLEAWSSWREALIGGFKELLGKYPSLAEDAEVQHLKTLLEEGPVLIDVGRFIEELDRDEVGRRRLGYGQQEWEEVKKRARKYLEEE